MAAAEINVSAAAMPEDYEPLARLLLRAEGVASSYIEGVGAPLIEVVLAETPGTGVGTPAGWVAANLAAVSEAVAAAHNTPLSVELMCEWHRTLMTGSPLPQSYVGVIRDEQGWIGGTTPLDAALVTPPPDRLPELLDDLVMYANDEEPDAIAQAAIAHAQFELIHPFADGNGRVGRVLISWLLSRRLALVTPPPVSTRIAADRYGYLAGLTLFRLGQHEEWVCWFAEVVTGAGAAQARLVQSVDALRARWREQLGDGGRARRLRRDALSWRVLELLPSHLVVNSDVIAGALGGSTRAAANALDELVAAGILTQHFAAGPRPPGRPPRQFFSPDLLALAGSSPLH